MKRLTLSLLCLCFFSLSAHAQNWPQFRGPSATGVVEGGAAAVKWNGEKALNTALENSDSGSGPLESGRLGQQSFRQHGCHHRRQR